MVLLFWGARHKRLKLFDTDDLSAMPNVALHSRCTHSELDYIVTLLSRHDYGTLETRCLDELWEEP